VDERGVEVVSTRFILHMGKVANLRWSGGKSVEDVGAGERRKVPLFKGISRATGEDVWKGGQLRRDERKMLSGDLEGRNGTTSPRAVGSDLGSPEEITLLCPPS